MMHCAARSIAGSRIIVALDFPGVPETLAFVDRLDPQLCRLKVGFESFVCAGPQLVEVLVERGFDVFLDLKFHDIPNTVGRAVAAACGLGVWMLNVHALGGRAMLEAAREARDGAAHKPHLIAVTVLTSLTTDDLRELAVAKTIEEQVLSLATLSASLGLDGVVCSGQEVARLRQCLESNFVLVTPGIRLESIGHNDDQKRIMTPIEALKAGSDFLVIGRPITGATDPLAVIRSANAQLDALNR